MEDAEKENNYLTERRQLIDHGSKPKTIRIRDLTLEILEGKTRTKRNETALSDSCKTAEDAWLRKATTLTFNCRGNLALNRKMKWSKSTLHSDYDIICLCEIWLTEDVTTHSIFLENYNVYKNDKTTTETRKSRHGGVLIAVGNLIAHEYLTMKWSKSDNLVREINLHGRTLILCGNYKAPTPASTKGLGTKS